MSDDDFLPPPPIDQKADLRDFATMPLNVVKLFNSTFDSTDDDTGWRFGVTLWCKAWHQVPAGSLPDDDRELAKLVGMGRDVATWLAHKATALHGWFKCSDGRLYNLTCNAVADDAWAKKLAYREKKERDRERKREKKSDNPESPPECDGASDGIPTETVVPSAGIPAESADASDGIPVENGLIGRGIGIGKEESSLRSDSDSPAPAQKPAKPKAGPTDAEVDAMFEAWWELVPLKVAKGSARRAFATALKRTDLDTLKAGIMRYGAAVADKDSAFIAHPATWLNGQRWLDEPTTQPTGDHHHGPRPHAGAQCAAGNDAHATLFAAAARVAAGGGGLGG